MRRILRQLPDHVTEELREDIAWVAQQVEAGAKQRAPKDTGTLVKYLTSKVRGDGLSAHIGFRTKTAKRKAFYAHFIEFGTKGYDPGDTRKTGKSKTTKKISRRVVAQPARPFLYPAFEERRLEFVNRVKASLGKALRRASEGAGSSSDEGLVGKINLFNGKFINSDIEEE
ncbi:MAG: HK97-gp10 family putative phage morphogenesis protein [Alphaproteobacteria bacterium]